MLCIAIESSLLFEKIINYAEDAHRIVDRNHWRRQDFLCLFQSVT